MTDSGKVANYIMQERLQKIIARAGIASRRHAEQLILSGQVRVNGHVITELGTKADPDKDRIEAAGRTVEAEERRVYLLMNKPPEVMSTLADPEGRKTLKNLLRGFPSRVYPVGNLEYAATGLVFLTNDGDLAAELLKKWEHLEQIYYIKIRGMLTLTDLERVGKEARELLVRSDDARFEARIAAARAVPGKASDGEIEAYRSWSVDDRRNRAGAVSLVASEGSTDDSCDETGEEIHSQTRTFRRKNSQA